MSRKFNKIVLDVQHMGKPHRSMDRGAVTYQRNRPLYESDFCLEYASKVYRALSYATSYEPFLLTHGSYGDRARFANDIGADLYLACHLNSSRRLPTSHYSMIEISEYAGEVTRAFAEKLKVEFFDNLPVQASKVKIISKNQRGWSCINRVKAPALLLEPVFLNHPDGFKLVQNRMHKLVMCIVEAIRDFNY